MGTDSIKPIAKEPRLHIAIRAVYPVFCIGADTLAACREWGHSYCALVRRYAHLTIHDLEDDDIIRETINLRKAGKLPRLRARYGNPSVH